MRNPTDVALGHLRRMLARDPMLRDILSDAIPGFRSEDGFVPEVDVLETTEAHVVLMDLPGLQRQHIRVRLEGARLVIEGDKNPWRPDGARVRSQERSAGRFHREFLLPPDVDAEGVRAKLEHGVLRVDVPRRGGSSLGRDVPITEPD